MFDLYLTAQESDHRSDLPHKTGRHVRTSPEPGSSRRCNGVGRYKLLQRGPIRTFLFDVDEDRACENNLKDSHPIALTALRAVLDQFQGAPNKARWRSRELDARAGGEVSAEEVEMDSRTREQLKALGYFE